MKQADIDILLGEGEGSMLEYKEAVSSSLPRDLVAFANSTGGKILFGVRDDGTIVGMRDSNKLRARIQDIAKNCDPPVKVLVEPVGKVLVVTVRENENKPVQCADGFFWRQGACTQKLTRDQLRDFFRSEGTVRFDLAMCPKFRYPEDFDGGVVADIEESLLFIERNTRTAYRIERLRREEIAEYPMAALREAITNAVMHRDWFNEGANVFVEIYADRIEISNPGGLPKGMLPSDLGRKSVRNWSEICQKLVSEIGVESLHSTLVRNWGRVSTFYICIKH